MSEPERRLGFTQHRRWALGLGSSTECHFDDNCLDKYWPTDYTALHEDAAGLFRLARTGSVPQSLAHLPPPARLVRRALRPARPHASAIQHAPDFARPASREDPDAGPGQ